LGFWPPNAPLLPNLLRNTLTIHRWPTTRLDTFSSMPDLHSPVFADGFPMDILVANLVATFLLALVTALHRRQIVSDKTNTLIGTGIMGGLSTFSSFAYGSVVLMSASTTSAIVASVYVVISLVLGYIAVIVGLKLGGQGSA
jgi:fluoride exporter